jgi:signal transduction histidine kinase
MVLAGGITMVFTIGAFALLLAANARLGSAVSDAKRARAVLSSANRLENLTLDLEMNSRAFVLVGEQRFLQSYDTARAGFTGQAADLEQVSAAVDTHQGEQARQIVRVGNSYLHDYSVPLMDTERTSPADARSKVLSGEGLKRLAPLRTQFARFMETQRKITTASEQRSVAAAREAKITALAVAAGSLGLICLFVAYLTRVVVHPVRRTSVMAGALVEGDLSAPMPETSPGEIGVLQSTFNTMAGSLVASRDKLSQVAKEQGALRRIATLVARGVEPSEVFTAVAAELGRVLGADHTHLVRFEPDNTATVVGFWSHPDFPQLRPPLGGTWPIEEGTVSAAVLATARPARRTDFGQASDEIGAWVRSRDVRCVVGCPVNVEGRVWGAMMMHAMENEPEPGVTEDRMREFVELISTAIANAQGRSDLLASRARVVAAADESRRRIERRLHDGTQQRLVSLALRLRMMQESVAPDQDDLKQEMSDVVEDLSNALTDVQEISRGIAPPILSAKGLPPALRALARRSSVPVSLDVSIGRRLPEPIEAALYYSVSEALTNVAKHARASGVEVQICVEDTTVRLSVSDDGVGGADFRGGSGLVGLKDRVEALDGRIEVVSLPGAGTSLLIDIPEKRHGPSPVSLPRPSPTP